MKTCEKCKRQYEEALMFCPTCGTRLQTAQPAPSICSNCGRSITETDGRFCLYCGFPLGSQTKGEVNTHIMAQQYASATTGSNTNPPNSKFLNSVKKDFQKSESIRMLKHGAKQAAEKTEQAAEKVAKQTNLSKKSIGIIAAALIAAVLLLVTVAFNTHRCDECDKVYIGRQYELWGSEICKDCYTYWTVWE